MAKERAKKLIKRISGLAKKNIRKVSVKQEAINVGYSESYADSGLFKKTKTWQELLNQYLPKEKLAIRHGELVDFSHLQQFTFPFKKGKAVISDKQIQSVVESIPGCKLIEIVDNKIFGKVAFFLSPDGKIRKEALDLAYKLHGSYAPEQIELTKRKYQDLSNAELAELEKTLINYLLNK